MVSLTEAVHHSSEDYSGQISGYDVVATGETLVVGQYVQRGTNPGEIRDLQDDATTGFAGYMFGHAKPGEQARVYRRRRIITPINSTVAVTHEGSTVYADTSGTASNNPADTTLTSTSNLPVGELVRVLAAGAAGANSCVLEIRADGES